MKRYIGIDPSSKTGFVALDISGNVLIAKEIMGSGDKDPHRMTSLIEFLTEHVKRDDIICIESPAMHAQGSAVGFMWGLAHGIRMDLYKQGISYIDVSPSQVKKFASGKGNTKKDEMVLPIFKRWGFENKSDNVRDAFVLAQIARALDEDDKAGYNVLTTFQTDVIDAILSPTGKTKKAKKREVV